MKGLIDLRRLWKGIRRWGNVVCCDIFSQRSTKGVGWGEAVTQKGEGGGERERGAARGVGNGGVGSYMVLEKWKIGRAHV